MHELSIAQSVVNAVCWRAGDRPVLGRVDRFDVAFGRVSVLAGGEPERITDQMDDGDEGLAQLHGADLADPHGR